MGRQDANQVILSNFSVHVRNINLVETWNRWCVVEGGNSIILNKHLLEPGSNNPYFTFPYLHYQVSCVAAAFNLH